MRSMWATARVSRARGHAAGWTRARRHKMKGVQAATFYPYCKIFNLLLIRRSSNLGEYLYGVLIYLLYVGETMAALQTRPVRGGLAAVWCLG